VRWEGPHCGSRRTIETGAVAHDSVVERMSRIGYSPLNLPKNHGVEK
jgi:hypothetical protein